MSCTDAPKHPLNSKRDALLAQGKSSAEKKKLAGEKMDTERAREQTSKPVAGIQSAKTQPYIHTLLVEPAAAREKKDSLAQLQSEKLFGDNLMEIFKKKKVNSTLYPCDLITIKSSKVSSPLQQKPAPLTEVVPEHFRSQISQQMGRSKDDKKFEVEKILTDLLEEHKTVHRTEGSLFSKLNFIERAIGR